MPVERITDADALRISEALSASLSVSTEERADQVATGGAIKSLADKIAQLSKGKTGTMKVNALDKIGAMLVEKTEVVQA